MSVDRFQELLSELGRVFQLPLHPDKVHACSLKIGPLIIQMQLDAVQENLLLFMKIVELPPGRFRENVLREALKANALDDPRPGIFGYIGKTNHLVLFQRYFLPILDGRLLSGLFGSFYELGNAWKGAIERGQAAPLPDRPKI